MTFLHAGLAAAGFACVAIPIVIHLLFRRRRKPTPWAAMRFLLEAMRRQRRRLRLETLLLLAARCLMLACLAAAIARPLLSGASGQGPAGGRDVYLLIDNSIASRARDSSGEAALSRHMAEAKKVIDALRASDRVGLVTLAGPAEGVVAPASADARAVGGLVDAIVPADSGADINGGLERIGATLRAERATLSGGPVRPVTVHVFSEFLGGSADTTRPVSSALKGLEGVTLVASRPAASSVDNVQVVAIEPLRSVVILGSVGAGSASGANAGAETTQVRVTLRRVGALASAVTRLRLRGAEEDAAAGQGVNVRWEQGQSEATVTVQMEPEATGRPASALGSDRGAERVLVAEIDRDALEADNVRRRPVEVRDRLSVGVIAQRTFGAAGRADRLSSADWFRLALRPSERSPIEVVDIEPAAVDAPALASVDAVVIPAPDLLKDDAWTRLRRFADAGGLVIVSPPESASVHLWADRFVGAMGLNWRVAREASASEGGAGLAAFDPTGRGGDSGGDGSSIFALVSQEMAELTRPVTISRWLALDDPSRSARALLSLADGTAWMLAGRAGAPKGAGDPAAGAPSSAPAAAGRGLVVLLGSAPVLSWTDLPARPLMVPLVQELVRQGVGEGASASVGVAGQSVSAPSGAVELRRVESGRSGGDASAESSQRVAVGQGGSAEAPLRSAGVWRATDGAGRVRGVVVVNPDAAGARTDAQSPEAVREWLAGAFGAADAQSAPPAIVWSDDKGFVTGAAGEGSSRSAWTLPLFIAALALAVAELAMARWFSHAHKEREPVRPLPSMLDEVMGAGLSSEGRA